MVEVYRSGHIPEPSSQRGHVTLAIAVVAEGAGFTGYGEVGAGIRVVDRETFPYIEGGAIRGSVLVGDDMIGSVAGGGVLSKLSRRFGEGVVNGALTARVGLAVIELCRPLPRIATPRPTVGGVVRRALAGLFARGEG